MSKLTDTLVKAGYVAANQGHGAISRMLWKGAGMADQARSQVLLDLSRLEADPDGSYQELAPNWLEHASVLLERAGAQGDAAQVLEALKLIFHPTIEQGLSHSPIAEMDPRLRSYLFTSPVVARLRGDGAIVEPAQVATTGVDLPWAKAGGNQVVSAHVVQASRPRAERLLVLTDTNFNFMEPIIGYWPQKAQVRIRQLGDEELDFCSVLQTVTDRLENRDAEVPEFLRKDLQWADTVYVEWGSALAARLSGTDLTSVGSPRLLVRIHKFEAFTMMPLLTRWENVCDLITIAPPVTRALTSTVLGLAERTRINYVPNCMDLVSFKLSKLQPAAYSIMLVGYDRLVKDPAWALDVLEQLRQLSDKPWKLTLVGEEPTAEGSYWDSFNQRCQQLGVQSLGYRSDMPEVLRKATVILSSSMVEGVHISVQQGAASGCLPVVRNWPGLASLGGPETIYPADWVVDSPRAAAQRILDNTNESGLTKPEVAEQASQWTLANLDAQVTLPLLDQVVLGGSQ